MSVIPIVPELAAWVNKSATLAESFACNPNPVMASATMVATVPPLLPVQELLSRIRALLRRNQKDSTVNRSGITLDKAKLQASRDGEVLLLTVTEYKILAKLISERSIITRAALLDALWDVDSRFVDDNTLSVHISRLRAKVGSSHIKTIRGVGYQWVD